MFYIAYGSNMNLEQMNYRCPNSKVVCNGKLKGWKLVFNIHADVIKTDNENDFVPLIEELIKSRTDFMSCKNNIFVYILNPEEAVIQDLLRYITVSRSRFIYMNLFVENEEAFKEKYPYDSAEMILDNCRLFFECDADKIESITYKSAGDTETIKYEKDVFSYC